MQMRNITRSLVATIEAYNLKNPKPVIATMEAIAFQHNDPFGPKLESILAKYKDMVDSKANHKAIKAAVELKKELEDAIFSRLGIKVKIITDKYIAAVIPNVFVPHNPVIRDQMRWIYEEYGEIGAQDKLDKLKNITVIGSVNTDTAKVSGWFSSQELPVFLNMISLFKTHKQSVAEVTAILLHELGHAFEAIVYCSNVNTTNQILADLVRYISSEDRGGDINYVFNRIKQIDPKATRDLAEGLMSKDRQVFSVSTYRLMVSTTKSLMSSVVYDRTSFEALADNFASRFGYGVQLVTGLEKFEKSGSEYEHDKWIYENTKFAMTYLAVMLVLSVFALFLGVVGKIPFVTLVGAFTSYLYGAIMYLITQGNRMSNKAMVYDNIRDRYMRIRSQLVELIKDPEIPDSSRKTTLEQIKMLDDIISKKEIFENPFTNFLMKIFPSDRFALENLQAQQEMELLISNNLFISSSKLATFGKK